MIFNRQSEVTKSGLKTVKSDLCFVSSALDERGEMTVDALSSASTKKFFNISFNAENMQFTLNGLNLKISELNSYLEKETESIQVESITIDATTVGVPEILYILRWVKRRISAIAVNIVYVEPKSYPPRIGMNSEFGLHQFKLSQSSVGYRSLPGFTRVVPSSDRSHLIALLGFERVRLGQLIANDEGAFIGGITPIIGVPGFKPYYDKHTIFQNIESLKDNAEKPQFSSANNPYETFKLIEYIFKGVQNKVVNIAPIGTKPMAIGACLFVLNHLGEKVGVMYDHPTKSENRTSGYSKIHLYTITFNS